MAKQTFTTGQVLTAAQVNALQLNDYNQTVSAKTASYVLVAADAGTTITMNAAGATTITVNTALFANGDTLKVTNIGAGVCTITAGTATVSTSGVLTLAQYASGTLYFTSTGVSIWQGSAAGSSPLTTKGDVFTYDTANARLGVGTNNQVLTADSAQATGIKWATPTAPSTAWTLLNSGGTLLTGGSASTRTVSFSAQNSLLIVVTGASTTAAEQFMIGFNSDIGANYDDIGQRFSAAGAGSAINNLSASNIRFAETASAAGTAGAVMLVSGAGGTGVKSYILNGGAVSGTWSYSTSGRYNGTSAITAVNIQSNGSAWDAGTVFVYGA